MKHTIITVTLAVFFVLSGGYAGVKKPLKFELRSFANIIDGKATEAGFRCGLASNYTPNSCELALTSFRASNGEVASVRSAYFKSAEEAKRYFDWRLKTAATVTERGVKNDNGKRVGSRAVLLNSDAWEVMWTHASTFRSFSSADLAVALELEKQYRNPSFMSRALSGR